MALIVVLLGSICGFFGGIASWLFLDASLVAALSIWVVSGPASAIAVLLPSLFVGDGGESAAAEAA